MISGSCTNYDSRSDNLIENVFHEKPFHCVTQKRLLFFERCDAAKNYSAIKNINPDNNEIKQFALFVKNLIIWN